MNAKMGGEIERLIQQCRYARHGASSSSATAEKSGYTWTIPSATCSSTSTLELRARVTNSSTWSRRHSQLPAPSQTEQVENSSRTDSQKICRLISTCDGVGTDFDEQWRQTLQIDANGRHLAQAAFACVSASELQGQIAG